MSVLGWCLDGYHDKCPGKIKKSYQVPQGRGRNRKQITMYEDEPVVCDCTHHHPQQKAKATKRKKRK